MQQLSSKTIQVCLFFLAAILFEQVREVCLILVRFSLRTMFYCSQKKLLDEVYIMITREQKNKTCMYFWGMPIF